MRILYFSTFFITTLSTVKVYCEEESPFSLCTSRVTCTDCIRSVGCSWCSQGDFHGADKQQFARCNTTEGHANLGRFKCQEPSLYSPENVVDIIRNVELTEKNKKKEATSLKPQEISIKLRKGVPVIFEFEYQDPKDYPLDLYYLMDLTRTMEDDKEFLSNLGHTLGEKLAKLTALYKQGFGSFIDKVTMPYIRMSPAWLKDPCLGYPANKCITPYGFKHHLSLSENLTRFTEEIGKAQLSGSVDNPEGGFDALMQVMVCGKQIGWSETSRKVVIFATDAKFHIAGDGKLGGIIRPNSGKCHLNSNGEYTHSTEMDYPSIAQLSYMASENSVIVIFAVTKNRQDIYSKLAKKIEGAKSAILSADSSNVVDLVVDEYKNITSRVEMRDNFPKQYVNVQYYSKCLGNDVWEMKERNICEALHVGSRIKFSVQLEMTECPADKADWNQKYRIYPVGLPNSLSINLEMLCDCPCENEENWIINSPKCEGRGVEKCGLCVCLSPYFGKFCECGDEGLMENELNSCIRDNSTVEKCSGRGACHCGQCECDKRENSNERYSGTFCECDNFSCLQRNGEICSGHGACDCGRCQCFPNWSGAACDCSTDQSTCKNPENDEADLCNGHGICECGKCTCKGRYTGEFCNKCLHGSCPTKCDELTSCVQCKAHETGEYANPEECKLNCSDQDITIVDVISQDTSSADEEVLCKAEDATDQCSFYFVYTQKSSSHVVIDAQKTKECPPTPPIFWILLAIITLIVLGGLVVIIIWKLCTLAADRREFARFENERKHASFHRTENPLYHNPVGTYQNPMYGKQIK